MNEPIERVAPPTPERFRTHGQHIALQLRLAKDQEFLNPQNKFNREVTEADLGGLATTKEKLANASTFERQSYWQNRSRREERLDNNNAQFEEWKNSLVGSMNHQAHLAKTRILSQHKLGNIELAHFTGTTADTIFTRYFTDNAGGKSKIALFVSDIVDTYSQNGVINFEAIKNDLPALKWFAKNFGDVHSNELLGELIEAEVKTRIAEKKQEFITDGNEKKNIDGAEMYRVDYLPQGGYEYVHLDWLNQHSGAPAIPIVPLPPVRPNPPPPPPPGPIHPLTPPPPSTPLTGPTGEQLPFADRAVALETMFGQVAGTVDKTQPYFIQTPPDRLQLTDDELKKLELAKPLFINVRKIKMPDGQPGYGWNINPEVMPFVPELEVRRKDQRYMNAEKATRKDSGLFGLIAASAETPQQQAKLYKTVADTILLMHKKSHMQLLSDFLRAQGANPASVDEAFSTSLGIIMGHGVNRMQAALQKGVDPIEAGNDILLAHDINLNLSIPDTLNIWDNRIAEINGALQNNQLLPHHLRWIEFLSHSVDVAQFMNMMKTPAAPPPAG